MANHPVPALVVHPDDLATLTTWSRSRALPQRLVMRARIVLLASEGVPNTQIAAEVGASLPTVQLWRTSPARHRYRAGPSPWRLP